MKPPFLPLIDRIAAGSLRVWLIVGILLWVTRLRDRWDPLALVFYTTPWPAIACGFIVLALHAARHARWHPMRRYILFTGGAVFTWVALSWQSAEPSAAQPQLRVVFWNVGRPVVRFPYIVKWLRAQDADIIALAEALGDSKNRGARQSDWAAQFPEYRVHRFLGDMMYLVRGEVLSTEGGELGNDDHSYYGLARVRVRDVDVTVLQADIYGSPTFNRRRPLEQLVEIARSHTGERLLLLGDLNTPRDSTHIGPLRRDLTHTFEAAGRGFAETWPIPAPFLSIDHLWSNARLRPLRCQLGWTIWSDHRPIIGDYAVER